MKEVDEEEEEEEEKEVRRGKKASARRGQGGGGENSEGKEVKVKREEAAWREKSLTLKCPGQEKLTRSPLRCSAGVWRRVGEREVQRERDEGRVREIMAGETGVGGATRRRKMRRSAIRKWGKEREKEEEGRGRKRSVWTGSQAVSRRSLG